MEALKLVPTIALVLAVAGIIVGASVVSLSKFGETVTKCYNSSFIYNTSMDKCAGWEGAQNGSTQGYDNFTSEYYGIKKAKGGETTVAEQIPTIAIIAVMVIIISLLAGTFAYMALFR